jgi:hypothetical protein
MFKITITAIAASSALPEQPAPSKPCCRQIEQLQLTAFVGSSASTLNETAPQWHELSSNHDAALPILFSAIPPR